MADRPATPPIPGVYIRWARNPLQTLVELDETGKLVLWHRLKIEQLEERIVSAHCDIDQERLTRSPKPLEECVAEALRVLDLGYLLDEEKRGDETLNERIDRLCASYVDELLGEHDGDCICVACSCVKCHAETLLGFSTIKGLGNHAASKIKGAFREAGTLDGAVQWLRDYRPVYPASGWRGGEEDWNKHVPRWIEEGKHAYEWLDAYRREHWT